MIVSKILLLLLLAFVRADKKIELQDIEDDNLKSENEKVDEKPEGRSQGSNAVSAPGVLPLDLLKSDFLRYFSGQNPVHQPRYVQQYSVTEQTDKQEPKPQYGVPTQQTMVGYLSNVPMQIYLVPQYYNDAINHGAQGQQGVQYQQQINRVAAYQTQEPIQPQSNYIEVPTYVTPSGKGFIQPYPQPVTLLSFVQPTVAPTQATVTPVLTYQMPVVQYPSALAAPPLKNYYPNPQYETNAVDEEQEFDVKNYPTQSEVPFAKTPEYPRYYNSRAPIEEYRSVPNELPPPSPLLLKAPPPHLAHLPKALPIYRPVSKPVYATGGGFIPGTFTPRPSEAYGVPFKRRPTSLLDSYIPSSVQLEYLKRGYVKDPLSAYEALSSSRQLSQSPVYPRQYERGFLPNQMYHTAAGGVTYGHQKRTAKVDKV